MPDANVPDPGRASTPDDIAELLRSLKSWCGSPSYETIVNRVNRGRVTAERVGKSTVVDCFRPGRKRFNQELVVAVVGALYPEPGYVNQWRQVLRVIAGLAGPPGQVRVVGGLPPKLPAFTGRDDMAGTLRRTLSAGATAPVVLQGMPGAGKTQLAVHLGHLLLEDRVAEQALFVDLRGYHPDEAQPPADPAAVLDGFLRSLGVPGQLVPASLPDRIALFRERLAHRRVLVVLDNAADENQVEPLLSGAGTAVVVVTSRRALSLPAAVQIRVDVFAPGESERFLAEALRGVPYGDDERALSRIAGRCGHLPLALALAAGQMRSRPGWTLTDHADWLDDCHAASRLESGIELAFDISYRELPDRERRLLRLLSLHPGQFDADAAAALAGTDRATAGGMLAVLARQHVVQAGGAGRYVLHDLVRDFAAGRGVREDRRTDRRAARNRLLDYFLAVAGQEARRMEPGRAVGPDLALRPGDESGAWLDTEFGNLVAMTRTPAAGHDRPGYPVALSAVLYRYLVIRGRHQDALMVHGEAARVAQAAGDVAQRARAVMRIATTELAHSRYVAALDQIALAQRLAPQDVELGVLVYRAVAQNHLGRTEEARRDLLRAVELGERAGARPELLHALLGLGTTEYLMGRYDVAVAHYERGLGLARSFGDRWEETAFLTNLGEAELRAGRTAAAEKHLARGLDLAVELGNQPIEAGLLDALGSLHLQRGDHRTAGDFYRRAIGLGGRTGSRYGVICATNGLGHTAMAAGDEKAAILEYTAAYEGAAAPDVRDAEQQAVAQAGLGEAHRRLGNRSEAQRHLSQARQLWTGINAAEADRITTLLMSLPDD